MFNTTLTHYRQRAGIKKADLARRVAVSLTYISGLESGRQKPPTRATCEKLAQALALNAREGRELVELAVMERVKAADLATIQHRLRQAPLSAAKPIPAAQPMAVPVLAWEKANRRISEDDIPIGLKTLATRTSPRPAMFALEVMDSAMAPEFQPGDMIVIDPSKPAGDGDFVLAADTHGATPLLRQLKTYDRTRVLHAMDNGRADIVLSRDKRYVMVGKVVERAARAKTYE